MSVTLTFNMPISDASSEAGIRKDVTPLRGLLLQAEGVYRVTIKRLEVTIEYYPTKEVSPKETAEMVQRAIDLLVGNESHRRLFPERNKHPIVSVKVDS